MSRDIRVAWRILRRQPVFLTTAVTSLAVAIAVNTAAYSMLDAMMNPRVAGAHPERLFTIRYYGDIAHVLPKDAVASALGTGLRSYEAASGYKTVSTSTTAIRQQRAAHVRFTRVRDNFFSVAGIHADAGRLEPVPDVDGVPSVVISDRLAGSLFSDDDSPIGATIDVDGRVGRIVGVARRYAAFDALDSDVWMFDGARDTPTPVNLIRLRAGYTAASLSGELKTLAARLAAAANEAPRDTRFYFKPITRQFRAGGLPYALVAAGLAVLLVACANVGNLQLARGLDRARELAVRASMGATRRHLVVMLLTESGVIATAGLALGIVLSYWTISLLRAGVPPEAAGYVVSPDAGWRVVPFAALVAIVCLILTGLFPALRLSDVNLDALIKRGTGTGSHRANRVRYGLLVVAQIGLTLPLVTAAVLLARGYRQFADASYPSANLYGFDPDSLIVARLQLRMERDGYVRVAPIAAAIVDRARNVAGVSDAGIILAGSPAGRRITVLDASARSSEVAAPMWTYRLVSAGYLRAADLPVEKGRGFTEGAGAAASVIVDRATSIYLWPLQQAVGRSIKLGDARSDAPWLPVTGVVGDHLNQQARNRRAWLDTLQLRGVYKSITADDSVRVTGRSLALSLSVRPSRDPLLVVARLRSALGSLELARPPVVFWGREEYGISQYVIQRRFMLSIFGAAAVLCLALAALGVYSIVAQSVAQRRREIAVRISLGATPAGILRMILREGNVFVLAGAAVGLLAAVRTNGWLAAFVPEWSPEGAFHFALVTCTLFLIAALAALGPAARATRIDPAEALRAE